MSRMEGVRRALILSGCIFLLGACPAAPQTTQDASSRIEVNVNRVFMPVVIRDKQGRAVSDLKKEDFQVFDNDKMQAVSAFTVQTHAAAENKAPGNPGNGTHLASLPDTQLQPPATQRFVVFIFDDLHLSIENLPAAKAAGIQALAGALVDSDMAAVVSTSGKVNSGLTHDHARLKDAMLSLQPLDKGHRRGAKTSGFRCQTSPRSGRAGSSGDLRGS